MAAPWPSLASPCVARNCCGWRARRRASAASLGWFVLLGYGARWLAPVFARPRAWQVLDSLIGLTMAVLAALLLRQAIAGY